MRVQTLITLLVAAALPATADAGSDRGPETVRRALQFFAPLDVRDPQRTLAALRPPPVGRLAQTRALASLPDEGALEPDARAAAMLEMARTVLQYHERDGILVTKVIDLPQAAVALHARTVLLITAPALRVLSVSELQALVAHEVGHDYFWEEYERLRGTADLEGRRILELKCDGVALLTLAGLGLDASALGSAADKLTRFNARIGAVANADAYPDPAERKRFARELLRAQGSAGSARVAPRSSSSQSHVCRACRQPFRAACRQG